MKALHLILWLIAILIAAIIGMFLGAVMGIFVGPAKLFQMVRENNDTLTDEPEDDTI